MMLPWATPSSLDYFTTLVADDASLPLMEVAVALAHCDDDAVDIQSVLDEIEGMTLRLKQRMPADPPALQRLRHLNRYFFQELGFAGNVNDYYDPDNSLLHRVIRTRRGIPITLAVLYIEFASSLGLRARGVSFPGHFLVKVRMHTGEQHGEVIIDPFTGASLSRDELNHRLGPYKRRHGLVGDDDVPLGMFLQAATGRDIVARMLRNMKEIHQGAEDWVRLLPVQERLVVLLPDDLLERRDLGLVLAELDFQQPAVDHLETYLSRCPDAVDAGAIAARIDALRTPGPRGSIY